MKPWPEEIRKRFPLHRDQDPQRPWWRSGFGVLPTRTDGLPLPRSVQGHQRWRLPGEPWATLDRKAFRDAPWKAAEARWPGLDDWLGGITGFQFGWANNAVRYILGAESVGNPALVTLS